MAGKGKESFWRNPITVCVVAIFCCILWGSAFPSIKLGYRWWHIGGEDTGAQIVFAGLRFAMAGCLTLLFGSLLQKRILYPKREAARPILVLAMCQTVVQYFFFYVGLAETSGTNASIITATNVFLSILLASLVLRQERMDGYKILGCVLGFLGVFLVNACSGGMASFQMGDGAIFLSALSSAISAVCIKNFSEKHHPVMLSGSQFLIGGLLLVILGMCLGGRLHVANASLRAVFILLYLSAVSAVAYTLWGILLKYHPVSKVAIYGFSNPVAGVFLSMLLLGEEPEGGGMIYVSLLLVSSGIFVVNWFAGEDGNKEKHGRISRLFWRN